jgi:hypothetical protein
MPRVVLIAKSTYVWLDQLSRAYGRDIRTLDGIPDEELETLRRWGVTGLWLIGLWERSKASERIKRMRGQVDAVASAYSLDDYAIAEDLGGEAAYANLRDRRMGPRHPAWPATWCPTTWASIQRWVIEHPEWFLTVDEPPYPVYAFTGPDLSTRSAVGSSSRTTTGTTATRRVVLQALRPPDRATRYVYHGNDGTSFPWERHGAARTSSTRRPRAGHPDDLRRRPAIPDHPFRRGDGPGQEAHPAPWWPSRARAGGIPSRA